MSRIQFSSTIEEITGKLAGSVFQDSYMGIQIRSRVSPRNPQSYFQQLRRGEFGYLSAGWRQLSAINQATWLAATGTLPAAFRLYVSCNINLTLINEAPVSAFVPGSAPIAMPMQITTFDAGLLEIAAVSSPSVVPANCSLLIQITYEKKPSKLFTNPSNYSPVISFTTGSSLAAPVDITAAWVARYGQFTTGKRLCLKAALVSTINGIRSQEVISCAIESFISVDSLIDSDGSFIVNNDGTFITSI